MLKQLNFRRKYPRVTNCMAYTNLNHRARRVHRSRYYSAIRNSLVYVFGGVFGSTSNAEETAMKYRRETYVENNPPQNIRPAVAAQHLGRLPKTNRKGRQTSTRNPRPLAEWNKKQQECEKEKQVDGKTRESFWGIRANSYFVAGLQCISISSEEHISSGFFDSHACSMMSENISCHSS